MKILRRVSLIIVFLLLLCSCEKRYKMVTCKVSSSVGEMQSESEIKAENDSVAYSQAIIEFFMIKNGEDALYKDGITDGYRSKTFKLYNSNDETIIPPYYSEIDLMRLGAFCRKDSTEIYQQICKNLGIIDETL